MEKLSHKPSRHREHNNLEILHFSFDKIINGLAFLFWIE